MEKKRFRFNKSIASSEFDYDNQMSTRDNNYVKLLDDIENPVTPRRPSKENSSIKL